MYFDEHFHHVRIDGHLVDEAAYHVIHCSAIFELLRNGYAVVLAMNPILGEHL